jgi:NTP pyrophosphatase (non-canonical NTP hydrolase)
MCIEEMSELTKALLKLRRASTQPEMQKCRENIREEIADVQIMIDQMRMVYGDTAEQETYKIQRLRKRMVL